MGDTPVRVCVAPEGLHSAGGAFLCKTYSLTSSSPRSPMTRITAAAPDAIFPPSRRAPYPARGARCASATRAASATWCPAAKQNRERPAAPAERPPCRTSAAIWASAKTPAGARGRTSPPWRAHTPGTAITMPRPASHTAPTDDDQTHPHSASGGQCRRRGGKRKMWRSSLTGRRWRRIVARQASHVGQRGAL